MAKLPPDAATLLEQLRRVDDPTPAERERADTSVRDMLAAHGVRQPPRLLGPVALAVGPPRAATTALKVFGGSAAALVLALGFWSSTMWHARISDQRALLAAAESSPLAPPPIVAMPDVSPPLAAPPMPPAQPVPAHHAQQKAHSSSAAEDPLAEELRLLASVDADIRGGAYDHALRRLSQNEASSPLQEERLAMRVLALCGRDQDSAAARARDQFLKRAPSSLLAARVRSACKDVLP